jgi:hypothetical protein
MVHGYAREGEWRGNWRLDWVASTLTLPRNMVYSALLRLMRTPRLPVVDGTDAPADLNWLVRFAERRNVVSARVSSHFKRSLLPTASHDEGLHEDGVCQLKSWWMCIGGMLLYEKACGQEYDTSLVPLWCIAPNLSDQRTAVERLWLAEGATSSGRI